jgi:sulfate permease, SulP family
MPNPLPPNWLLTWLPFLRWWPLVNRHTLRADGFAGLTGALVLVPQGVAFATIAGMPPEYGLYAAMWPAIIAALWGSSWHLVSGPTTAISIVVFASVSPMATAGTPEYVALVITLTFWVGVFQLLLGLFRWGALVNFVSHTVVVGFTAGAAVLIAISQVGNFLGLDLQRGLSVREVLVAALDRLGDINPMVVAVALATLVVTLLSKRVAPRWPSMLVGLVAGGVVAALINAAFGGEAATGIRSIGSLTVGLPPLSSPDFTWDTFNRVLPAALAISLLGLTEAVSIARSVAAKTHQRIDGNQEFVGQGLSNLVAAFFSGYASSGSFNRTGLNHAAGALTPMATIIASLVLMVIVLFLAPLTRYVPIAAMAGVLMVVAWGLFDWREMLHIVRVNRTEAAVLLATLISTLAINMELAIFVGVGLSLFAYLRRTSQPPLREVTPGSADWPASFARTPNVPSDVAVRSLEGSIYFGAVHHLQEAMHEIDGADPARRNLLLLAHRINFVDLAGAQLLAQEAKRRRALGGGLYLHAAKPEVVEMLRQTGALEALGADRVFDSSIDAVAAIARAASAAKPG